VGQGRARRQHQGGVTRAFAPTRWPRYRSPATPRPAVLHRKRRRHARGKVRGGFRGCMVSVSRPRADLNWYTPAAQLPGADRRRAHCQQCVQGPWPARLRRPRRCGRMSDRSARVHDRSFAGSMRGPESAYSPATGSPCNRNCATRTTRGRRSAQGPPAQGAAAARSIRRVPSSPHPGPATCAVTPHIIGNFDPVLKLQRVALVGADRRLAATGVSRGRAGTPRAGKGIRARPRLAPRGVRPALRAMPRHSASP